MNGLRTRGALTLFMLGTIAGGAAVMLAARYLPQIMPQIMDRMGEMGFKPM